MSSWKDHPTVREKIVRAAYHEAGHAVAWYLRTGLTVVVRLDFPDPGSWEGTTEHSVASESGATFADIIVSVVAGRTAEARYAGLRRLPPSASEQDTETIEWAMTRAFSESPLSESQKLRIMRKLKADAWALWDDPKHWVAIQAIATALLETEYLTSDTVMTIIQDAMQGT